MGTGGAQLFDWHSDGDTPSTQFRNFRLSAASAEVFDTIAGRSGAIVAGRRTYDDSRGWGGGGPHPTAPLFVLSHRPAPASAARQTFIGTGIADAIAAAGNDVALMGSGVLAAALRAGLVDEVIIHQVPVLLGGGIPFFGELAGVVRLTTLGVTAAPGVTHLSYAVVR